MTKTIHFLKYFFPISIALFLAQKNLSETVFEKQFFLFDTIQIYSFHAISTLLIYIILVFIQNKEPTKTGFAFMAASILKMLAVVLFLLPLIQSKLDNKLPSLAAFFVPYFMFLIIETYFSVRLIHGNDPQNTVK